MRSIISRFIRDMIKFMNRNRLSCITSRKNWWRNWTLWKVSLRLLHCSIFRMISEKLRRCNWWCWWWNKNRNWTICRNLTFWGIWDSWRNRCSRIWISITVLMVVTLLSLLVRTLRLRPAIIWRLRTARIL